MQDVREKIFAAQHGLRILFQRPLESGTLGIPNSLLHHEFLTLLSNALLVLDDTAVFSAAEGTDYFNLIADKFYKQQKDVETFLFQSAFEQLIEQSSIAGLSGEDGDFVCGRLETILLGLSELKNWLNPANLNPNALKMLRRIEALPMEKIRVKLRECDPFLNYRSFRYFNSGFLPVELKEIRDCRNFFGFESVRNIFSEHFKSFVEGKNHTPLLVSSLPGHGKTQLTLSHALAYPELTLILADPGSMEENLPELLDKLSRRPDRKFVLFFDDIIPDEIDWYFFRTHIGGSFALPDNILVVIASNYHFPPSILSRGRSVLFPIFDELRCMEMVEDFLISLRLSHPKSNLISIIAADYTEYFGQKRFSELSPRTLIRYLKVYESDFNKRRTMLELSLGEFITTPDASLFYDFNIQLMRNLYGKEFIEDLLKERLRQLEKS